MTEGEERNGRAALWGATAALIVVAVLLIVVGHGPLGAGIAIAAALAAVVIGLLGGGRR